MINMVSLHDDSIFFSLPMINFFLCEWLNLRFCGRYSNETNDHRGVAADTFRFIALLCVCMCVCVYMIPTAHSNAIILSAERCNMRDAPHRAFINWQGVARSCFEPVSRLFHAEPRGIQRACPPKKWRYERLVSISSHIYIRSTSWKTHETLQRVLLIKLPL